MVGPRTRSPARPLVPIGAADLLIAVLAVSVIGFVILLTPAFTDYEVEAEPALRAFARGDFVEAIHLLPVYAGSLMAVAPGATLAHLLGGGDLAVFRAAAAPGAIGVAALATVGARWMREAGGDRLHQLAVLGAIALSPCLALSWSFGHVEEPLVAAAGLAGLMVIARGGDRSALLGGVILGLAAAGKLWAVVLLPVGLAAASGRSSAVRVLIGATAGGTLLIAPYAIAMLDHLTGVTGSTGLIFSRGNIWWFLGAPNPAHAPDASTVVMFTSDNSARLAPTLIAEHARKLVVLVAAGLALAWAYRDRHSLSRTPTERLASVLMLAAAVLWWRALLDPWFQPYYLTGALMALVLADARTGRLPLIGLVAWTAIWLIHGPGADNFALSADQASALSLLWTVPVGVAVTRRAFRLHE